MTESLMFGMVPMNRLKAALAPSVAGSLEAYNCPSPAVAPAYTRVHLAAASP